MSFVGSAHSKHGGAEFMISSTSAGCTDSDVYSNLLMPLVDSIKTKHTFDMNMKAVFFF